MTEMVTSGLMRGCWRRSDGPLEGDTRPKRGETAWPRTPCTPPRQRPTLLVMGFQYEADARQMVAALAERLAQFRLALHRDKTRLLEFGKLVAERRRGRNAGRLGTFAFLGFTHYCAWSRDGRFVVKRRTEGKRVTRKAARGPDGD